MFLSAMSLPRTSKDLNSCPSSFLPSFLPSALRQTLDKNQNLEKQINPFHIQITLQTIPYKKYLPKSSPQKVLQKKSSQIFSLKKILPKLFSQNEPPKKFLPINSSKNVPPKKSPKNPKKFLSISQKIPEILKISNSLDRT